MAKTKVFRKLAIGPPAILAAMIVVLLSLLGWIRFQLPSVTDSAPEDRQGQQEPAAQVNSLVAVESQPGTPETTPSAVLVDVLIDGDSYWVQTGQRSGKALREIKSLEQITRACEQVKGDAGGVRIRVTRTFAATAQAEQSLVAALAGAGLADDEIDLRRTLVTAP
jgi:hypothetical protein